jgi:hypothetical protein
MSDEFISLFPWIADVLERPIPELFKPNSPEYEVLLKLKREWGMTDTATLFRSLSSEFGEVAGKAFEKFLESYIVPDWEAVGQKEARPGKEMECFIHILWDPLKAMGFEYESIQDGEQIRFKVTKCPIFDLAEKTGLHDWLYHMACATDFFSTRKFSERLGFDRTKTLMQGGDFCDHRYFPKGIATR